MNLFKRLCALFLAVAFASVLGCAGSATQESTGEYVSDSWITTKVKAALVEDPLVRARDVNVETFKGAVQLSGFVSSSAAMHQAVQLANGIRGVTSVSGTQTDAIFGRPSGYNESPIAKSRCGDQPAFSRSTYQTQNSAGFIVGSAPMTGVRTSERLANICQNSS